MSADFMTTDPAGLTAADLPALLDKCEEASRQIDAIRAKAKELMAAGGQVKGWRLSNMRRCDVIDPASAFLRLWSDVGKETAVQGIRVSIPAVAYALSDKEEVSMAKARERIERILSGLITFTDSPRLVRERWATGGGGKSLSIGAGGRPCLRACANGPSRRPWPFWSRWKTWRLNRKPSGAGTYASPVIPT